MMNFHRYSKLDLPVYHEGTPLLHSKALLMKASEMPGRTFIRPIHIDRICDLGPYEQLKTATKIFEIIAEASGVEVIEHTWGLYHFPRRIFQNESLMYRQYRHDDIPERHIVIAEVAIIDNPCEPDTGVSKSIRQGIDTYEADDHEYRWLDAGIHQYRTGVRRGEFTEKTYQLDIEPLLDQKYEY